MNRNKNLQRLIIFTVLCALLFSPALPARAQEPQQTQTPKTITVNGAAWSVIDPWVGEGWNPLLMIFPPAGGPVTGIFYNHYFRYGDQEYFCSCEANFNFSGTFAGGDGGAASGTITRTYTPIGDIFPPDCPEPGEVSGTWNGNFYANGTGNGTFQVEGVDSPWKVTYLAADFAAALAPVTKEYILSTYGLKLEGYYDTDWSQHELELLNDVLKEIPADLWKKMALTSITRSAVNIDENMKLKPGVVGDYSPCGDLMGNVDCSGSSANIRIFDSASSQFDFADDPNGDTEFKATILHEMIHAMQYQKDSSSTYANPYTSPLVRDYMEATRPGIGKYYVDGWTCCGNKTNGWELDLNGTTGNEPPTAYGKTNPLEDMTESAMMYVYDPQRLKNSSQKRYDFIKKNIFGDIEYDNGQKKP